jgi:starvation-inducible outer membrane lipoprotein
VVALGGTVTQIDAVNEGYRLLISELPLDGSSRHRPAVDRLPRGLFMVLLPTDLFSTDVRAGAEVTVVGEVMGKGLSSRDSVAEEMLLLQARHMRVWGATWWPRVQLNIWGGITP